MATRARMTGCVEPQRSGALRLRVARGSARRGLAPRGRLLREARRRLKPDRGWRQTGRAPEAAPRYRHARQYGTAGSRREPARRHHPPVPRNWYALLSWHASGSAPPAVAPPWQSAPATATQCAGPRQSGSVMADAISCRRMYRRLPASRELTAGALVDSISRMNPDQCPVLGLILPHANRAIPEEGIAMYGQQLRFAVTGLGIERMTAEGFDAALARIPAAAQKLKAARCGCHRADRHHADVLQGRGVQSPAVRGRGCRYRAARHHHEQGNHRCAQSRRCTARCCGNSLQR